MSYGHSRVTAPLVLPVARPSLAARAAAAGRTLPAAEAAAPYDKRELSYATTFDDPWSSRVIRTMEWATGKATLLRLIRRFEAEGAPHGQAFWPRALAIMGIALQTPEHEIRRIPAEGPVIVASNHPHGLVDGMVLADLIGRVRTDYRILSRSLLTGVQEVAQFLISVPFPHETAALEKSLDMRRRAMAHLEAGGCVVLFPSGSVACADRWWGPAVEQEWNPFTAKLIARSGATVVPIRFTGQNSRAYQIAAQVSPTLRQGLLLHEVVHALNRPQRPVVGEPIPPEAWRNRAAQPRAMMAWLRQTTLGLAEG